MKIEIVATGDDRELHDFQEKLRDGHIVVFLTHNGTVSVDFIDDFSGRRFLARVGTPEVGLVLKRPAQTVRR